MRRQILAQALALVCLGSIPLAAASDHPVALAHARLAPDHGRCFPARLWNSGNVPLRFSPCARITRVYEDGSVKVAVIDRGTASRHGAVRYTFSYGAADR